MKFEKILGAAVAFNALSSTSRFWSLQHTPSYICRGHSKTHCLPQPPKYLSEGNPHLGCFPNQTYFVKPMFSILHWKHTKVYKSIRTFSETYLCCKFHVVNLYIGNMHKSLQRYFWPSWKSIIQGITFIEIAVISGLFSAPVYQLHPLNSAEIKNFPSNSCTGL